MPYRQIINPNLDNDPKNPLVVYVGGKPLNSWKGWCLAVTDASFGVLPFAATALDAWNVNTTKHQDRNIPEHCYIPIFYSGDDMNWGHVAICYRDGNNYTIWSSPYTDIAYFAIFKGTDAIDQLIRYGYGTKFLGWTETLGSKRIIEYYEQPTPEPTPAPEPEFKVGDKVVPITLVDYYGTPLVQYDDEYTIMEINGDRAVLGAPRNGHLEIWAAMNTNNIRKV